MFGANPDDVVHQKADLLIKAIKQKIHDGEEYGTEWGELLQIKNNVSGRKHPYLPQEETFPGATNHEDDMYKHSTLHKIEGFLEEDYPRLTASKMRGQGEQLKQLQLQVVQMQNDHKLRAQQQSELMATMQSQLNQIQSDLELLTKPAGKQGPHYAVFS